MVIDSKVSLTAYEQYVNSEEENEKMKFLKNMWDSLKRHVEQLSAKKYEDLHQIESPRFCLTFHSYRTCICSGFRKRQPNVQYGLC